MGVFNSLENVYRYNNFNEEYKNLVCNYPIDDIVRIIGCNERTFDLTISGKNCQKYELSSFDTKSLLELHHNNKGYGVIPMVFLQKMIRDNIGPEGFAEYFLDQINMAFKTVYSNSTKKYVIFSGAK